MLRIIAEGVPHEIDPAFRDVLSQMFPDAVPSRTIYKQVHRADDINMVPGTQIT